MRKGRVYARGGDDGEVVVFTGSGNRSATISSAPSQFTEGSIHPWVWDMAFIEAGPHILVSNQEDRISLWNARSGGFIANISLAPEPSYDTFTKLAVSLDGQFAAFGGRYGKRVYLWNLQQSVKV